MLLCALITTGLVPAAHAAELYAGDGFDLRWDNTLRYSTATRIASPNATLLSKANGDDGDRGFAPGLVSNRLDLASQLDLAMGDFGLHASAAGWYDSVYHSRTDNRSPATYNVTSTSVDRFAPGTRDLHGAYAELDDAFLYGSASIADIPLSLRLGRQTVLWGESLFFDANSIASAQAPIDYTRTLLAGRGSYSNNVYLPVTQVSVTAQLLPNVSLSVYDQFEARPSRQDGDGSYLSYVDYIGTGASRLFLSSGKYLERQPDRKASASGQFGVALHTQTDGVDIGLYALRYNSTDPSVFVSADSDPRNANYSGDYWLVYPKDISLFGISASTSVNNGTIAGELSVRQGTPLLSYALASSNPNYPAYVRGDLLHAQLSGTLMAARSTWWDGADLSMEVAADDLLNVDDNLAAFPSRFAMKAHILFEPHYFQVLPNLDLTIPIGLGYNITGQSYTYYAQNAGTGDWQIGVSALYRSAWKASLTLMDFIGSPARQPLADRTFIAASLERTF